MLNHASAHRENPERDCAAAGNYLSVLDSKNPFARRLAIILAIVSVVSTILIGRLGVACQTPFAADSDRFRKLVQFTDAGHRSWRGIHVLAAGCPCSRNLARHLLDRGGVEGFEESVLLIGNDSVISELIHRRGIPLRVIQPEESSERYHIEGAPWFVLVTPDKSVAYAGGYASDRNTRDGYHEISIWKAASAGADYRPYPVYGCAIGTRGRRAVDPLHLFRWSNERTSND